MSLKVIGAGFGRTATLSVKLALDQIGYPCHHMACVFENPDQLPYWQAAVRGDNVDWDAAFAGFSAAIDWPSTHYWSVLAERYPDAKVLLTVRPVDEWWASFEGTIKLLLENHQSIQDDYKRTILAMAYQMIAVQQFDGRMDDAEYVKSQFQDRIDQVASSTPPERLLIFDADTGWDPLCEFVGVPIPDTPFPRVNNRDDFWQKFGDGSPPQ